MKPTSSAGAPPDANIMRQPYVAPMEELRRAARNKPN